MRCKTVMRSTIAIGLASWIAACAPPPVQYAGPGCLIYLYSLPGLQGSPLPVRSDTSDLVAEWHEAAASGTPGDRQGVGASPLR